MDKAKFNKKDIIKFLGDNAIVVLLALLVVYVSLTQDGFLSGRNLSNIISNVTPRLIIALGVSGCLIIKGTDLSAGRAVGLAGVVACTFLQREDYAARFFGTSGDAIWNVPALDKLGTNASLIVVCLAVVALCALFGLINGLVISKLNVPAFLATLGMQTIIYGANCVYSNSIPVGGLRKDFGNVTSASIFKIGTFNFKYLFLFAIVCGAFFWFLYNKTRYGKYMYAIGGNENAAEVSGVNVTKAKILIYTLAGAMYGLAGFILASKAGGASVNLGQSYELTAIASCTIGGVSTNGGVGKVSGILLGVLVFELLGTSMQFLGINPNIQQIVQGVVIIVAVALDIRKYTKKR